MPPSALSWMRCFEPTRACLASTNLPTSYSGVPRMREALRVLVDDGLATQLGELAGVSRAAVRFQALSATS